MTRKIFLVVSIFLLTYLGFAFFREYFDYHTYYFNMLESWRNSKIVLNAIIFGLIPAAYIMFSKRRNFWVVVGTIFAAMYGYGIFYISSKASLIGGAMKFFFNTAFLLGLALVFIIGLMTVGMWIWEKLMKAPVKSMFGVIMNLGLGLVVFLVINYILVMTNLFYPIISWLIFAGMVALIVLQRNKLTEIRDIVDESLGAIAITNYHHIWSVVLSAPFLAFAIKGFTADEGTNFRLVICLLVGLGFVGSYVMKAIQSQDRGVAQLVTGKFWLGVFTMLLLILSFMYLDMGYMLAYIPYSTAWDANHAYMFYPRMWALNNGYFWDEVNMAASGQLWFMYIAFWFSLFVDSSGFMGISADTIAIQMNFWSGIFVLVFGLGLVSEITNYLSIIGNNKNATIKKLCLLVGWFLILLWLTSGMGAFLVFIDNKTDLGVLAMIILAVYSGFVFLRHTLEREQDGQSIVDLGRYSKYLIVLSGFFYGIAMLTKPTAAFDVANFGLFFWWLHMGIVGTIGSVLMLIGFLAVSEMRGIVDYVNTGSGKIALGVGGVMFFGDFIVVMIRKTFKNIKYLLFRLLGVVVTVVLLKAPVLVANNIVFEQNRSGGQIIKGIFLSHTSKGYSTDNLQTSDLIPLYAQNNPDLGFESCNLSSQGYSDINELYDQTREVVGSALDEDVGRYIGYGWKGGATDVKRGISPFIDPRWAFAWDEGCHGFSPLNRFISDAVVLCENESSWRSWNIDELVELQESLIPDGEWYKKVGVLIDSLGTGSTVNAQQLNIKFSAELSEIEGYMQDHTVKVVYGDKGEKIVYFPYKFLNIFNVSFNWSIQNLSSYYTDIGIVWLILFFFNLVGLCYGVVTSNKVLSGISLVTLFGWILRWFIGGGILWYAIGIIVWTILSFLFYVYFLLEGEERDGTFLGYVFVILFVIVGGVQMVLNLQRIASQGGGGAFIRYKTNFGMNNEFAEDLTRMTAIDSRYSKDDVFNLQFPHYRDFVDLANKRDEHEGAVIAGTYARYFIDNQHDIKYDQFLIRLWEMMSDGDPCNSYLRLKDQNIKYIVIDPNIGTVVQGAGNQSLFDRFFAKVDNSNNTIIDDGVFTMLAKMYQAGYIDYVSSNNLGAKYAFSLPNESFDVSGDALTLFRARMALMRFFGGANSPMFNAVSSIAYQRVQDGTFITDIADLMGLQIRENKLIALARKPQISSADTTDLTNDERSALSQFLGLRGIQDEATLSQQVTNVVGQGIGGGNQIIVLELKD